MLNGLLVHDTGSVTRFGEILPLWPIFKIFGNIFKVYLVVGKVFSSLWYNLYAFGQIFIAENGQILKAQSGRLVTLGTGNNNCSLNPSRSTCPLAPWTSSAEPEDRSTRTARTAWPATPSTSTVVTSSTRSSGIWWQSTASIGQSLSFWLDQVRPANKMLPFRLAK